MLEKFKLYSENHKLKLFDVILLCLLIAVICFNCGYFFNSKKYSTKYEKQHYDDNLKKFIDNYNYIVHNYYEQVDKEKLIDSAIAGMTESLDDPYSIYISDNEADNLNITLNGEYEGLGIAVSKSDSSYIKVEAVFEGSAAAVAGIIEGDLIKSINGKDTSGMEIKNFSNFVLESKKDIYKLIIIRNNEELTKELNKKSVTLNSVQSDYIEKGNKKIGYIYISVFANNTISQFMKELKKIEDKNIDSLIIDVRNNTGGHLTTVTYILNQFLTKDQVLYQLKTNKKIEKIHGTAKKNKKYNIVLLGNSYSASASEVLIAGLRENLNSIYIGKKTYGKGTVQEMVTLGKDKEYKITTKKWLTPKGNWVNDTEGILPDIEVDLKEGEDSQYNKAIELITNEK